MIAHPHLARWHVVRQGTRAYLAEKLADGWMIDGSHVPSFGSAWAYVGPIYGVGHMLARYRGQEPDALPSPSS